MKRIVESRIENIKALGGGTSKLRKHSNGEAGAVVVSRQIDNTKKSTKFSYSLDNLLAG